MGSSNSSVEPGGGAAVNKKQVLHFVQDDKLFGDCCNRLMAWVLVLSLG
jgi:hypothetical protein